LLQMKQQERREREARLLKIEWLYHMIM
jgi:hypothetical protein